MRKFFCIMLLMMFCCIAIIGFTASRIAYASDGSNETSTFEDLRIALIEYYNSQTITHVGYVLTLGIALATVCFKWKDMPIDQSIKWRIFLFFIMSLILSLLIYLFLRIVYYASLFNNVIGITPSDISNVEGKTDIARMHNWVVGRFQNRTVPLSFDNLLFSFAQFFFRTGFELSMIILIAIFLFVLSLGYKVMKWAELNRRKDLRSIIQSIEDILERWITR